MNQQISEREQHLLKVLVERYIRDGQPVGSKTLAEDARLQLSPATIRNIMADLEARGYVHSPHTSAGRVPTQLGYRFFVDTLLTVKPLDSHSVAQVQQQLRVDVNVATLMNSASSLLSSITKQAGLVTLPRREKLIIRHVEFLPLAENRVLVVLVLNSQEVQNRVIYTDRIYSESELQQVSNFLNMHYAGQDLLKVRQSLINEMRDERKKMDALMQTAIDIADKAFTDTSTEVDYVMAGQANLLGMVDTETSVDRIRLIFEAFSEKRAILKLLDQCLHADGVQIFIGSESGYDILQECSMVAAPYSVNDQIIGVLGVIGPTRMQYDHVIPMVDLTAKILSSTLGQF